MAMNPWIMGRVMDERVRDLRAGAGPAPRTASGSGRRRRRVTSPRRRHSLAYRAAHALVPDRLRPA